MPECAALIRINEHGVRVDASSVEISASSFDTSPEQVGRDRIESGTHISAVLPFDRVANDKELSTVERSGSTQTLDSHGYSVIIGDDLYDVSSSRQVCFTVWPKL